MRTALQGWSSLAEPLGSDAEALNSCVLVCTTTGSWHHYRQKNLTRTQRWKWEIIVDSKLIAWNRILYRGNTKTDRKVFLQVFSGPHHFSLPSHFSGSTFPPVLPLLHHHTSSLVYVYLEVWLLEDARQFGGGAVLAAQAVDVVQDLGHELNVVVPHRLQLCIFQSLMSLWASGLKLWFKLYFQVSLQLR